MGSGHPLSRCPAFKFSFKRTSAKDGLDVGIVQLTNPALRGGSSIVQNDHAKPEDRDKSGFNRGNPTEARIGVNDIL